MAIFFRCRWITFVNSWTSAIAPYHYGNHASGEQSCSLHCRELGGNMRKLRVLGGGVVFAAFFMWSQEVPRPPEQRPRDTVQEAQRSVITGPKRPEQSKTPHDQSD